MLWITEFSYVENNLDGKTCYNNENFNGTVFGQFRCPLNDFPQEARECCGDYGKQFCCIPDFSRYFFLLFYFSFTYTFRIFLRLFTSSRSFNGMSYLFWVIIIVILFIIIALIWVRYQRRQRGKTISSIFIVFEILPLTFFINRRSYSCSNRSTNYWWKRTSSLSTTTTTNGISSSTTRQWKSVYSTVTISSTIQYESVWTATLSYGIPASTTTVSNGLSTPTTTTDATLSSVSR